MKKEDNERKRMQLKKLEWRRMQTEFSRKNKLREGRRAEPTAKSPLMYLVYLLINQDFLLFQAKFEV